MFSSGAYLYFQGVNLYLFFRRGQLKDEYDDIEPFLDVKRNSQKDCSVPLSHQGPDASFQGNPVQSLLDVEPAERNFQLEDLPDVLKLPAEVGQIWTSNSDSCLFYKRWLDKLLLI